MIKTYSKLLIPVMLVLFSMTGHAADLSNSTKTGNVAIQAGSNSFGSSGMLSGSHRVLDARFQQKADFDGAETAWFSIRSFRSPMKIKIDFPDVYLHYQNGSKIKMGSISPTKVSFYLQGPSRLTFTVTTGGVQHLWFNMAYPMYGTPYMHGPIDIKENPWVTKKLFIATWVK